MTVNEKGEFPTRFLIPTTTFTATFSEIGYLGIKRCLDKVRVNYSRDFIFRASKMKERLEELGVNRKGITTSSVDAINMYPSINLATIRKAVRYFARKITKDTKKTINLFLELVHFGMSSTLISFDGEYYEYHRGER